MNNKVLGGVLLLVGIVAIVAGIVVMAVIVPSMKQFPDDVDTSRSYDGTMSAYLFAERDDAGNLVLDDNGDPNIKFIYDITVKLQRRFATEETDGGVALVSENQALVLDAYQGDAQDTPAPGDVLQRLNKNYVIDRKSMEHVDADDVAKYGEKWAAEIEAGNGGYWVRQGLVLGWPIDSEKKDYVGWSDDYRDTVDMIYAGKVKHERADMDAYLYTSTSPNYEDEADPGPRIVPDAVDAMGLPKSLSKGRLIGLLAAVSAKARAERAAKLAEAEASGDEDLIAQVQAEVDAANALSGQLVALAGSLPDEVPLQYFYKYFGEYWVEPQTGVLLDTAKHEVRAVGLDVDAILAFEQEQNGWEDGSDELTERRDQLAAFDAVRVQVFELNYQATDESVQDAKKDAEDAISTLNLFGTYVPVGMIIAGIVLGLIGAVVMLRKRAA